MTPIHAIKTILIFFCLIFYTNSLVYAQKPKKERINLLFKKNDESKPYYRGKKFVNKNGINFNLFNKGAFIHKNGMKKDTLSISELKNFVITDETKLKEKSKLWHEKNKQYFIDYNKKHGVPAPPYDRNGIFETYIIEKINSKQIVVYEVKFRNEGAIE